MFNGFESLKFIDFANLGITNVNEENSNNVFLNCKNLEYINMNFKEVAMKIVLPIQRYEKIVMN